MNITENPILPSESEIEAWSIIDRAEKIIITSHIHPDGDAIGSSLAMLRYCRSLGKQAEVVIDDNIPIQYRFLINVDEIIKPINIQNLNTDLLIIVDTNPRRIGNVGKGHYKCVLNIDHHDTNLRETDYHIVRGDYSSTSELLFHIFRAEGYEIDTETAKCLYTGLITDTVYFKAPGIKASTFEVAAELIKIGADSGDIASHLEEKDFDETRLVSKALSEIKNYNDGTIVGVTLDERFDELELTDSIIDAIRYIRGVRLAFLLKHEKCGGYRVRMRSQSMDVSEFAQINGGGGHTDAAGFTIDIDDGQEAEMAFIERLEEWLVQCSG